jgi:hypothetical protein
VAQWNGQFTGNTHATKVKDCEGALRHAVDVLLACETETELAQKRKAVINLAEKLLIARIKLLKAKINDSEPVTEENQTAPRKQQLESLRQELSEAQDGGLHAILLEFGLGDINDQSV